MIRRRHFLASMTTLSGIASLRTYPAKAGLFDFLNDSDSPVAPAGAAIEVQPSSDGFQDIYQDGVHITRQQFSKLQSGQVQHWSDLASKPYGRLKSEDGLEHYYFKFAFGDGGVILICNTSGIIQNWQISGRAIAPEFSPANMSDYNYYPPRETAAAPTTTAGGCYQ